MNMTSSATLGRFASSDDPAAYLFSITKFQNNLSSILRAFQSIYPGVLIAYSFKTNYLKAICEAVLDKGQMAEVVSPYEYDYARTLGFHMDRIVYNGVIPDAEEKFKLAARGGYVNVDNIGEYNALAKMAQERNTAIQLGVRVNFDCGNNIVSRFGVDVESEEFATIMADIQKNPLVRFGGFHTHIGSSRQISFWGVKAAKMIELAQEYGAKYIDLGGGMFGQMPDELSKQFNGYVGSYEIYADVVAGKMAKAFPRGEVKLILEPGTALVGNTMKVVAKIANIKKVQDEIYVTMGCCSNHIGMLCDCRDIPATAFLNPTIPNDDRVHVDATLCGDTCLEFDYIKKHFVGDVAPGDVVVFENCGAYSISASRQFIVPRLPVYSEETGDLIMRGETSADMLGRYYFW